MRRSESDRYLGCSVGCSGSQCGTTIPSRPAAIGSPADNLVGQRWCLCLRARGPSARLVNVEVHNLSWWDLPWKAAFSSHPRPSFAASAAILEPPYPLTRSHPLRTRPMARATRPFADRDLGTGSGGLYGPPPGTGCRNRSVTGSESVLTGSGNRLMTPPPASSPAIRHRRD